jgi:hypothetical protein
MHITSSEIVPFSKAKGHGALHLASPASDLLPVTHQGTH